MRDRKKLPNFAKIRERIEKGQTKREEVKAYRELAAWKTLMYPILGRWLFLEVIVDTVRKQMCL